ncbi:TonB-dependent receptor [Lysobacter sp. SG-8]|uniref:TonB-dependent receptor n=1 Tax=Marilutibacter penaei TaxID=2759900 RepID=A0A7W3YEJ2_9GAMM|nr:TonB-dependent receptor [Lysobacter penaei]MBB1088202.1 TonB-dependent receptor [Lysobacter penaei]
MTVKTTQLRDAITIALAVGATAAAGTGVAVAQETEQATTLDRIEVTGSRIKRTDIETSQPIFSLSREDISAQGLTSVGDVIQNISANGSTLNTTQNNGGNGETRVNLRNLGSNRTLVLVNGRRWVGGTGLGGAVDLNTIPTAAVERIEVLKDGASSIYGSDAIAGVVNVILRQNFDGAEANAYLGQFDKGDGVRQAYDFTVGSTGDRWSAMLGVGYVKEDPVWAGDREISAVPVYGSTPGLGGSSTTPDGRYCILDMTTFACANPDGAYGLWKADPNDPRGWSEWAGTPDNFNFAPLNYLLTPQERISVFANGSLDISDNLRFKTTVTYNQRQSEQLLAAMPVVVGFPGASQAADIVISQDSLYNPYGEDINWVQRRVVETGGRSFKQTVDTYAFDGAFEGSFEVGERYFDWEAGMFYGENRSNDATNGLLTYTAIRNALGPSMLVGGVPTCVTTPGDASTAIAGCVPANFLGGAGSLTPEMLSYLTFEAHDQLGYSQKSYFANISGDLFDLPGGAMAFSFGLEHREEDGYDRPDALINAGDTTGNARTATGGGYSLDEAYLELAIPVLADVPGAQLLDFSIATRYSDYSNFGDTLNSKFGFRWKPIDDLLIRGNYAEGFRAPSINELFQGVSDTFPTISDPCNTVGFAQLDAAGQARCVADGVPQGGYNQVNSQIRISTGGNPNLLPEKAENYTFGFVYSPSYIEGFDISLDWWKIELTDTITTFSGNAILDDCYEEGNAQACSLITRGGGGFITDLLAAGLNIGSREVEGYDMTIGYRLPETDWGKFSFIWDSTYMVNYEDDGDGDNQVGEYTDRNNNWRIRSNLSTRWEMGDWGATWNLRYYDAQVEACSGFSSNAAVEAANIALLCSDPTRRTSEGLRPRNKLDDTFYNDVSVYWNAPWNGQISLGINNILDEDPPRSVTTFANSFDPQYEVPGRFMYMRYSQKF